MYRIIGADGREYGPVTTDQFRQWIAEGRVNAETKVLVEGATTWQPAGTVPELSLFFTISAAPPGTAPSPAPLPTTPPARQTHPLATTGLVLGILSITIGLCCCSGFPFSIAGLICSIIGLSQTRSDPQRYSGEGVAIAGLILSILGLLAGIGLMAFGLFGSGAGGFRPPRYRL